MLAVAAVAMLCVGAATFPAPGGNAPGAIGARASLGSGRAVEPGAATVGTSNGRLGADVENGADAPYKHPENIVHYPCLLYTSPSPRDRQKSRMPSSA